MKAARSVLYFSPFLPWPVVAGNRRRVLSLLDGLVALGCNVRLLTVGKHRDPVVYEDARRALFRRGIKSLECYAPGRIDFRSGRLRAKLRRWRTGYEGISDVLAESPFCKRWMQRQIAEADPEVVWTTYAPFDRLFDHAANANQKRLRVIDMIDLVSIIHPYLADIGRTLERTPWQSLPPDAPILDERYFERLGLRASREELGIYDKYTHTLAISPSEAEIVAAGTSRTKVVYTPMAYDVAPPRAAPGDGAILVLATAPVNVLGFAFFAKRVLPRLRDLAPDFHVRVVGAGGGLAEGIAHCEAVGFVDDLDAEYARARFAIVPTLGWTGQQVRIVEAMAQGIPVVAMEGSARSSPMVHGENGLVARTAEEFAEHAARLWSDPALCRRLGSAARDAVAATCSTAKMIEGLDRAIFGAAARSTAPDAA